MGAAVAARARDSNVPVSRETRRAISTAARAVLAKRYLYWFLREAWGELEPGVEFKDNWHVKAFCDHVQWMLEGWLVALGKGTPEMRERVLASWAEHGLDYIQGQLLVQNMIWNLPPGTLKSRILMVCAPAWMWLHEPAWSVCAISGNDDNVKRDSNAQRELVTSAWYRQTFNIKWRIMRRQDSVANWKTTAGGERKSRSMGSGFTGVHCNALFLDDPDDADRVWNESARKAVQNKWTRAIKNRGKISLDLTLRIAIQQRVHIDDWTAAQVSKGIWSPDDRKAWAWIAVPVFYGMAPENAPKMSPWGWRDPRRAANDNLQPAIFSDEALADEERDKGPEGFAAQYNQNPERFDGGMIQRSDVRLFRIEGMPVPTRARPAGVGLAEDGKTPEEALVLKFKPDGRLDIDWLTVTVDCSNGSERVTASAVGILVVGGKGMQRFVFDDLTDVMDIDTMYDRVADAIEKWPATKAIIELKAAGASVIANLKKRLARGDIKWPDGTPAIVEVISYNPQNDSKESRAAAMVPAWRAGLIYVLEGQSWLYPKLGDGGKTIDQGFIGEICTYPKSKRDDRIDALGQCLAYYDAKPDHRKRWRSMAS
jgi:phage terminase large subunit-like protein